MARLNSLLERDGYLCGIHMGGCGQPLSLDDATLDHIISKQLYAFSPERPHVWGEPWNSQPMHAGCNRDKGNHFTDFTCECHSHDFQVWYPRNEGPDHPTWARVVMKVSYRNKAAVVADSSRKRMVEFGEITVDGPHAMAVRFTDGSIDDYLIFPGSRSLETEQVALVGTAKGEPKDVGEMIVVSSRHGTTLEFGINASDRPGIVQIRGHGE